MFSDAYRLGAPKLHHRYECLLNGLHRKHPELAIQEERKRSVLAASTFNATSPVVSIPHKDFQNFGPGWCAITALGKFNPTNGGHLILWEFKLVIEFPRGSTILIPSALVTHSNTTIGEGETRMSITQYTAGALFRWAACGYRSMSSLTADQQAELKRGASERAVQGIALFSKLSDVRKTHDVQMLSSAVVR